MAIDARLRVAVDAGLDWYVGMCAAHGVRSRLADGVWRALDPVPALHSAALVIEPGAGVGDVEAALAEAPHRGVADCFGTLDLTVLGLRALFEASWLHLPAPSSASVPAGWSRVAPDGLERWNAAGDTTGVIVPSLLERPTFAVLASERAPLGCVATLGTGAVYLTNVRGAERAWDQVVTAVGATFPGRSLVTYDRGEDLAAALEVGFTPVGTTRIWVEG
ncbi:hypothetical protein [Nocardioides sp.]|uniref:hypothetical protein n=1 Tax=Nocardioides sp. TaxID=35761 RepID=UPI0035B05E67